MGLGDFLNRISGKSTNNGGSAFCFVFGSDKRFVRRTMTLQGTHIQDNANRMAYFCSPDSNGVLSRKVNGMERTLGPVNVAYEPITELYRFPFLNWGQDRNRPIESGSNGHGMYDPDPILDNGFSDGFNLAAQKQENFEVRNKLMTILLLAVLGTVAMFLLVASSTGLLSEFIEGAGNFFGG